MIMSWEIVVGIITLVGFIVSIGKIVKNNTEAMTEIKVSLGDIKEVLKENKEEIKELQSEVGKHETRITVLEKK